MLLAQLVEEAENLCLCVGDGSDVSFELFHTLRERVGSLCNLLRDLLGNGLRRLRCGFGLGECEFGSVLACEDHRFFSEELGHRVVRANLCAVGVSEVACVGHTSAHFCHGFGRCSGDSDEFESGHGCVGLVRHGVTPFELVNHDPNLH